MVLLFVVVGPHSEPNLELHVDHNKTQDADCVQW